MWSDDMDKKIQDAAGNYQPPPFREDDWNGMNVLLDKHLPEEKKKRPFLLGMLFFLLIGFPVTVMLTTYKTRPADHPVAQTSAESTMSNRPKEDPGSAETNTVTGTIPPTVQQEKSRTTQVFTPAEQTTTNIKTPASSQTTYHRVTTLTPVSKKTNPKKNTRYITQQQELPSASPADFPAPSAGTNSGDKIVKTDPVITGSADTDLLTTAALPTPDSLGKNNERSKDSLPAEEPVVKKDKPAGKPRSNKWQLSFSAGPDLSMVGVEKTGKWKMQYGIGIGYSLSERFQVRTGFMVSRKLYYADSSDYHPPKGFWNYYTNLQKIDANCLVYEIPLNLVYTFPSAKKHQWFVSGGVSSYLMKSETYEYYFKDNWGVDQYRKRTVDNQNNHFLSILHLSGGYQYKFSDKLSLMAEPYVKLPLSGVGFGKVKLNNTGMLFTIGFKPFVKSR
jgi:hypothetical protein